MWIWQWAGINGVNTKWLTPGPLFVLGVICYIDILPGNFLGICSQSFICSLFVGKTEGRENGLYLILGLRYPGRGLV